MHEISIATKKFTLLLELYFTKIKIISRLYRTISNSNTIYDKNVGKLNLLY